MKKLSLVLILAIVFSLSGCTDNSKQERADTVYVNWFGQRVDLSNFDKVISRYFDMGRPTLEGTLKSYESNYSPYVIIRARCTGDWTQKVYEDIEHRDQHFVFNKGFEVSLYMEIPYEVLEILEGDMTIVKEKDNIVVEIPGLCITHDYLFDEVDQWKNKAEWYLEYMLSACGMVYSRVGYEYVIALHYNEETQCYVIPNGGGPLCELSTPEDNYDYRSKIENKSQYPDYDDPNEWVSPYYWDILERYNITIE